ncbi:MAG: hypothetical protein V9G19_15620 [Tetrasphaera sp.]
MRGASTPTGLMIAPGINGFAKELNEPLSVRSGRRQEAAGRGRLSAAASRVTLDCPNDRYVNDEAICQAVVPMLARVGVTVKLNAQTKSQALRQDRHRGRLQHQLLHAGLDAGTYDAHNMLYNIVMTRERGARRRLEQQRPLLQPARSTS